MTPAELRDWRTGAGLDQGRLADRLGVHRVTVNRWEQGHWPIPHHLGVLLEHLADVPQRSPRPVADLKPANVERLNVERHADGWVVTGRENRVVARFGPGAAGYAAAETYLKDIS